MSKIMERIVNGGITCRRQNVENQPRNNQKQSRHQKQGKLRGKRDPLLRLNNSIHKRSTSKLTAIFGQSVYSVKDSG